MKHNFALISFGRYSLSKLWKYQCKKCGCRVIGTKFISEAEEATEHIECNEKKVTHVWFCKYEEEEEW